MNESNEIARTAESQHRSRRLRHRGTLALTAGATVLALTAGTAQAATRADTAHSAKSPINLSDVTLHIGDQAGAGAEALLKAAGLLTKLPFKATWADFSSGPPMMQAESAGSIDVGSVGDAPPVFALSGGAKVKLVEAVGTDPNGTALLVSKGSTITKVSQLKGKTIAVAEGSSSDYHLLITLEKAGLNVKEVKLDYLQPAEALAALTSDKVAAWDIWSPYIEEVEVDGARPIANGSTTGTTYSWEVASDAALANPAKAAAIKVFLTDLTKAYAWEKTHPSAWATTWGQATGLSTTIMDRATKDDIFAPVPITSSVERSEQSVADAFYTAGLIPKKVNISSASYTGFNSLFQSAK